VTPAPTASALNLFPVDVPEPRSGRALQAVADEAHAVQEQRGAAEEREEHEIGRGHRGSIAGYWALSARR
jgi:hypothetical protein